MKLNQIAEMAAKTYTKWGNKAIDQRVDKDAIGIPKLARPGFRTKDKQQIENNNTQVENWLNNATESHNIHWVVGYLEPSENMAHGEQDWPAYAAMGQEFGQQSMTDFHSGENATTPPPDPSNTIVYIKPTSRVHTLTPWQQIHNIGHAVWQHCVPHRQAFEQALIGMVDRLQKSIYNQDGVQPTKQEVVVTLARLLDVQSFQRIFGLQKGDLGILHKNINTAIGSFDEAMYELIAVFLRNKGHVPLRSRGEVPHGPGKVATPDRRGKMEPNQELNSLGVRQWVWEAMASNDEAWQAAALELDKIIVAALRNCVWASAGSPIYATVGTISTEP